MRLKGLALLFAIFPVLVGAAMPVSAQTLADFAKKEEERRKKIPEPAKIYTNKDLAAVPATSPPAEPSSPSATPATGSTAPAASATPAKEEEKEKGTVKDEKYWAGRLKTLQENLTR